MLKPKTQVAITAEVKQQKNSAATSIPYRMKHVALRATSIAVSPLATESEWSGLLRNVQQSFGGWGSELLELRRSKRLIPIWSTNSTMDHFQFSDAD